MDRSVQPFVVHAIVDIVLGTDHVALSHDQGAGCPLGHEGEVVLRDVEIAGDGQVFRVVVHGDPVQGPGAEAHGRVEDGHRARSAEKDYGERGKNSLHNIHLQPILKPLKSSAA